jgi:hypothetical protein
MDYGKYFKLREDEHFDEGKARFALEQANERLKFSVESIDKLKYKSYIFFGALVTIILGLVAYMIEKLEFGKLFSISILPSVFATSYLIIRYFILAKRLKANLASIDVWAVGNTFDNIFASYTKYKFLEKMLIAEALKVEKSIAKNLETGKILATNLDNCWKDFILPPIFALIIFVCLGFAVGLVGNAR